VENHVEIRNLKYEAGGRLIFDDISLTVPRGRIVALLGPSGVGKTTLLKLIGGQLRPKSGSILVDGRDVPRLPRHELFELRRNMGMLFQSGALFTDLTVFENVAFPLRIHTDLPEGLIRDLVLIKLQAVGLRAARDLMPAELSGGMARRVALARAIALDPDILLYDEPFTGLDPIAMGVIVELIHDLNDKLGLTSVIVSHDIKETMNLADLVYVMSEGRIIGAGAPAELQADMPPMLNQFVRGLPDGPVPFHYPGVSFREDLLARGRAA
jgi:phospholipid/cholesterol/gamma-HCH transport system ATP-binding protein